MTRISLPEYPWYGLVSGNELQQGDILLACPVFVIPRDAAKNPGKHPVRIDHQNVIVMSQSCDLAVRSDGSCNVDDVIFAPVYSMEELKADRTFGKKHNWENARKGRFPGYHVLNRCEIPGHEFDYMVVDFRRIFTLSLDTAREYASGDGEERVRLLPPYREHLSQGFARFFMRVGLPADIAPFK
jgi:hypothetical protein